MPNENLIDTVITTGPDEQVISLTKLLADLDIQMIADIKSANALNSALSNSKSFTDYNANATKTALQLEKIQQAQNKTAESTIKLDTIQKKAAADQQARDEKAAAQLAAKQAKQAAADAKEIANAEAKATKLDAIQKEAARKAAVQFPASQSASNPVTQDTGNVRYEPIITGNENMAITATKSTEAIAAENAVLLEQQEVLGSLTVAQRANIETLLALQAERAANAAELKALNVEDAVSGERAIFLTAEQIKLKVAIQQTTLALNQQTKQALAEDTSAAQMQARLDELRVAYNNLSLAEKENIEIGGVWLAEINTLDAAVKKNAADMGVHNKEVGNYALAQNKAENSAAGLGKSIGGLLTPIRQLAYILPGIGMAGLFNLAFEALSKLVSEMGLFNSKMTQSESNLHALNEVQKDAASQAGQSIGKFRILSDTVKDLTISYEDRLKAAVELKRLWPDELANSSAQAIANGTEKESIDKLTDSVVKLAKARAAATQIEKIEGEIISLQIQRDKENSAKADVIDKARVKTKKDFTEALIYEAKNYGRAIPTQKEIADAYNKYQKQQVDAVELGVKKRTDLANKEIADQISRREKTIKYLEQYGGLDNEAKSIYEKPKTAPKGKDFANTDLLENNRIKLEEAKKQQKQILDDENYGYEARLVALKLYIARSKDLIANSEAIVNQDKTLRPQQRANELLKLNNQLNDIDREGADERVKIHKSELSKVLEVSKVSEQEQLEILDNGAKLALQALSDIRDKKEDALTDQRKREKISEKNFNRELLAINDQYAIDRIAQEIATQKAILAAKEGARDQTLSTLKLDGATPEEIAKFTSGANKGIQGTLDTIANLTAQYGRAKTKQKTDGVGGDTKADEQKRKAIEQAAYDFTVETIDGIDKLRQRSYENEMARLEKLSEQEDENAENQKKIINDSVASNATKSREIALIDAQTSSRKKALLAEENKEKEKAAKADKEATIAKLIAQGALAVVAALTAPPGIGEIEAIARAASVAVELAVALATPLPKYAQGTKNYPGGLGIWGEAGMERATLPGGQIRYSNGAELANFPKGTVITPHMELMQQIRPNEVKFVGGEQIPWRELIKAVKDSKQDTRSRVNVNVDLGFENYKRSYLRR